VDVEEVLIKQEDDTILKESLIAKRQFVVEDVIKDEKDEIVKVPVGRRRVKLFR
jgi:hypothetical protein